MKPMISRGRRERIPSDSPESSAIAIVAADSDISVGYDCEGVTSAVVLSSAIAAAGVDDIVKGTGESKGWGGERDW